MLKTISEVHACITYMLKKKEAAYWTRGDDHYGLKLIFIFLLEDSMSRLFSPHSSNNTNLE
jgi:hypothetical protein